jgi:hypothetical protein
LLLALMKESSKRRGLMLENDDANLANIIEETVKRKFASLRRTATEGHLVEIIRRQKVR